LHFASPARLSIQLLRLNVLQLLLKWPNVIGKLKNKA
jgi:hypothetical protein